MVVWANSSTPVWSLPIAGYFEPEWMPPLYRENPRCISNLFQQPPDTPPDANFNTFFVSYGQFVMHDVRGPDTRPPRPSVRRFPPPHQSPLTR